MSWYSRGLRFDCKRCGNCCGGVGSVVRVSDREIEALAAHVGLTPRVFVERHTAIDDGERVLLDRAPAPGEDPSGECEWLRRDEAGLTSCAVQDAKPDQCASYPFWPRLLLTRDAWEREARSCAGIGSGTLRDEEAIDAKLGRDEFRRRLEVLFDELDAEVAAVGARCEASGNCCDFPTAGHRLYTSRVEAERFARGVDLSAWDADSGLCPAWVDRRCTAREHRPTGCRVYYCDPDHEQTLEDVAERSITRLKWLHDAHDVAWDYRDFLAHLAELQQEQREDRA